MLQPLRLCSLFILVPALAWAQTPIPLGDAFKVGGDTPYGDCTYDCNPKVGGADDGSFVVSWSEGDLQFPGYYVYGYGIQFRQHDPGGNVLGDEKTANTVPAATAGYGNMGTVGVAPDGEFVVAWHSLDPAYYDNSYSSYPDDGLRILQRRFTAKGAKKGGSPFAVSADPGDYNENPEVAVAPDSDFTVVWRNYDYSTGNFPLQGRTFNENGSPKGAEFDVNTTGIGSEYAGDEGRFDVAADGGGRFMVVWDLSSYGNYGRVLDSDGSPIAADFAIAGTTSVQEASVAGLGSGGFVVAFDGLTDIVVQRYDESGLPVGSPTVVTPGAGDPKVAGVGPDQFVVIWQEPGGTLSGQLFDETGALVGSQFAVTTTGAAESHEVAGRGDGKFVVTWEGEQDSDYGVFAQRFGQPTAPADFLLAGKKLLLKNKVPDDPNGNAGVWVASDVVSAPESGSDSDPRCNGDADGTVKSTVRFFSNDSGHDSGEIDLPCENWTVKGKPGKIVYKYLDKKLSAGPCKLALVKEGKLIKVSCKGASFPYDLEVGTDEGSVHGILTLGSLTYCTSFDDFKGKNGIDGEKFLGKNAPAPGACPTP